ncbi:MAG: ABC transporter permease [Rhodocyclaceae bacterium]|jgi:ABC-2 type transport system permease protein|nr:ABC transporter permease [Rhodocyclaceae bacterium]MCA3216422.1 ABC transporter permease [Burkholderiales bacterium]MCA3025205.1 ABC transporter permease [Rhodocyclaceae bacterium]MCA3029380.1 ABC transporter permease [Rhodocyclaceae bacterium]MCA3030300.1 ABC transporter permease [Rhodocyclaceae bacterium]
MNLARVLALAGKEAREVRRDRLYLLLAFALPLILLVVFAYGMTTDVEGIGLVVIDEDGTPASRRYAEGFLSTRHFVHARADAAAARGETALIDARARVVLWIGPHFERDLNAGRPAEVLAQIDGAFTTSARTIHGYLEAINAQTNAELRTETVAAGGARAPSAAGVVAPVQLQTRFLYNPELRSVVTVAPSLLMLVLLLVPPLLIAVSVVREKESGAIFNIASSTVTRLEFLLGKLIPVVAIGVANGLLLWVVVIVWFGVPFRGSVPQFALAIVLYVLATSGLGLLVSATVRTQQAAIIITTITAVIVAVQFAGMFAPLETASPVNRALARLFPAADFLAIVRGMYLRGAGIDIFWPELLALVAYAVLVLALAHALFHKRTTA